MKRFLQLHILTSYPPSNVNRDDLGRPKTAVMGGRERLRISSQSLKRAWRTSEVFEAAVAQEHRGVRTKELGKQVYSKLLEEGVKEKDAREWARDVAGVFGKLRKPAESKKSKKDDSEKTSQRKELQDLEIEQLVHVGQPELDAIAELINELVKRGKGPTDEDLELLRKETHAADIALFGRMLASSPNYNVEAAAQVAHALTVHSVAVEDDFFSAVDDLNRGDEDRGAGHLGSTEFAAGLFYLYICIDRNLLQDNLRNDGQVDPTAAEQAIRGLVEAAATIPPGGKQNSFGSRVYASRVLAEKGDGQPRSLSVAYLRPVNEAAHNEDLLADAIQAMDQTREDFERAYGPTTAAPYNLDVPGRKGTLAELLDYCVSE